MSSDITFAELEHGVDQTISQANNLPGSTLLLRLEKLASHLGHCLILPFEPDDTPYGAWWAIVQTHKILVAVGGRLVQLEGTLTADEDRDLRILTGHISILFEQMVVRVSRFIEAFAKFETLQSGSIN